MSDTAIVCFVFRRPEHTRNMLASLARNSESQDLKTYVYCDGPRNAEDKKLVAEVVSIVQEFRAVLDLHLVVRTSNLGLAGSIAEGVSEILRRFEQVIVLEDDLVLSPFFLEFMLEALRTYSTTTNVISINGYFYPSSKALPETFFLRGTDCWGWGTWRRGWNLFDSDVDSVIAKLTAQNLMKKLNYGRGTFFSNMLIAVKRGTISSWAILWHAAGILNDSYSLFPGKSLVENFGNDGSGTHKSDGEVVSRVPAVSPVEVRPQRVQESRRGLSVVRKQFKSYNRETRLRRIRKRVFRQARYLRQTLTQRCP